MVFDEKDLIGTPDKRLTPKTPGQSKFEKQRAEDVVRNARDRGYLKSATEDAIWENIGEKCDLEDIKYLNMNAIHLHTVRSIEMCRTLRICVLSCNYITSFDALAYCRHLLFLDLHGNQITKIPNHRFWASLQELQVVYLHNNSVSKLEQIQYIASSSSLSILTLFDTPLSLKPNYRHHVVNSVWTLKALDFRVISDEEIIEDATFDGRFSAVHTSFSLSLYKADKKERNFEEALKNVQRLIAQVNSIQARNSPVLIVQKFIRGHLGRQRVKYLQDMRIWAAVSIQRFYRHYKGYAGPLPPPASPAPSRSSSALTSLDYDTYVKNMRHGYVGAVTSSEERLKPSTSSKTVSIVVEPIDRIDEEKDVSDLSLPTTPLEEKGYESDPFPVKITTKVSINLRRLETSTSDIIKAKEEAVTIVRNIGLDVKDKASRMDTRESIPTIKEKGKKYNVYGNYKELLNKEKKVAERAKRNKKSYRIGRHSTVHVFFGPILKTHPRSNQHQIETERNPKQIKFRLSGLEPPICTTDPLLKILSDKKEAGKMVRQAAREHELEVLNQPRKKAVRRPVVTTDQRLFIRTHGTMGMACLRAVQQAYRDRAESELKSSKSDKVAQMREERATAQGRVKAFKQDYQQATLRKRLRDGVKTAEALKERASLRIERNERLNTARAVTAEQRKSRQADYAFVNDFSCQQTSVSNALLKHDRTTYKEEYLQDASELVRKEKENSIEQQSLVKRFMEHRQLLRQAETAMARAELDSRLMQDATQRAEETKQKMLQTRTRQQQQLEYYSVPPTLAPPQLPPLGVVSPDQMEVWKRLPKVSWRPRLHDRSQSEPVNTLERNRLFSYEPSFALA